MTSGKYMARKRFFVPKSEMYRDYRLRGLSPSHFLFGSSWEVIEEDED